MRINTTLTKAQTSFAKVLSVGLTFFTLGLSQANPLDDLDEASRAVGTVKNGRTTEQGKPTSTKTSHSPKSKKLRSKTKTARSNTLSPRSRPNRVPTKPFRLSDAQWRRRLTPDAYRVLRQKGTERKNSGRYLHTKKIGVYVCAGCGHPLYSSRHKFNSGTGWPSFSQALNHGVRRVPDHSHGLNRTELVCARCESHLGHVFNDGPKPSGERHCVNSISLKFMPQKYRR